jgi:hypothetical protein
MTQISILKSIGVCVVIAIAMHMLLSIAFKPVNAYHMFFGISLVLWVLLGLAILYAGLWIAGDSNPNTFSQLVLVSVFLKLLLGIGMVVVYKMQWDPPDNYFVIPFLQVYLIFAVYETYALMKIGRDEVIR